MFVAGDEAVSIDGEAPASDGPTLASSNGICLDVTAQVGERQEEYLQVH